MTGMLFSEPNKRRPYRPKAYRSKFALENTDPAEEGLSGGEFDGDLTNDPLEDLEAHPWVAEPGAEEVVNQDEEFEREEDTLTNKAASSRRAYKGFPYNDLHNQPFIPGHKWPTYLYRGLAIKVPSDVEGELDFAMMDGDQQGVFQVGRKILDIISRGGIGRHWTTEPDVAMDFASMNKSSGNVVVVLSALWERDGEDSATEHEGYDGVVRPSRLVGEEEVTLKPGTRIKLLSMRGSRVLNGSLMERNFDIEFLSSPEMKTASQLVANDNILDSLNPTGTVFTDYTPEDRASRELAPNIRPYSEINDVDPDERMVVYRGVPKGVQSELADGDFITDMEQLAKDYAGYPYGDVISQEVFADEILDDLEGPMSGEYLFRPRRASKKTANDRRTFYHLTENPNFAPDPNFRPENNTTLGGDWDPGLFVAEELEPWVNGYDYIRPWVAEMSAPADIFDRDGVTRGYSRERMIPASEYGDISVDRIIPLDAYTRETFGGPGWAERHHEKTFDGAEISDWNKTWYAEGRPWGEEYRFEGDIRDWTPEQQDSYSEFVKDFGRQARGLVYEGDPDWEDDEDDFYYSSKKTAQDYFMEHRPAGPDFGSPLHDLNDTFPDIYDSPHYYDFGEPGNKDSFTSIQRAKGNPEEMVTMYRSIPSDGTPSFAPGDWVSTSGDYARQHSLSDNEEDDDFIVMEQQVPASSLWSEGNSVAEWGYHGDALDGTISEKYTPKKTLERLRSQKSSSRRVADKFQDSKYQPGTLYRGLSVDLLSDDEVNTLQDWATRNSFDPEDPDGFDFAEPNFEMIYPILERLEESGGLGRHWTKDYDVANEFSRGWANDDPGNQGVVLKVDWDGSGIDTVYDEATTTADGSTVGVYDEEKEVNLAPGAGANLVGIDFTDLWGNKSNIPVPDIPVYASKRRAKKMAQDYFMDHRPAGPSNGSPMHDVSYYFPDIGTLPRNVYDDMQPGAQDSIQQIIDTQGNPDRSVTIYRGVPKGVDPVIRNGDWVTISRDYAVEHGHHFDEPDVLSTTVPAKDLWTSGDSVNEFGYWGDDVKTARVASRTANSEFPALPEDFVSNISPDGFDSRWTYETTSYEPRSSDDRYELSINPVNAPSVIPGEENGLRKKPIFYDPERTELEWDDVFGHSPTRQDRDLSHLSPPEGLLWRGMSNEEFEGARENGYFQSKGDWNFEGQEGETYFSTNPDAAANYANDFAPIQFKPGFGNPAHVIGIPDRPDLPRNDHEVGVPGQIPFSDVVQHYTGHPTAISPGSNAYFNDTWTGEWSEGGGMGPSVSLAWEPGEGYKPKISRREAGTEDRPGNIYRGIASDFLTDDEYDQIVDWTRQNRFDPDNFQLAEPNYEMIYPILERLEEKNGLGRHWSTDYDVAWDFASQNAEHYDEHYNRDEDDPDYRSPFGIVFRGDWDGEGVDYAKQHRGYDGVMRPSDLEHEKEVTLHPGSEVNLLGIDILDSGGFTYDIPVPDVPIYSKKRVAQRKRENMSAINGYLRYANLRGLDPNDSRTSRAYRRASRNLSPKSVVEINNWVKAQKMAHNTANQVLATTRSYRHKISSSWHLDNKLNAYISKVQQKFACSCGSKLAVPSYTNCKCGKVWNAYKIHSATKGDTVFVVREIPVRENVLVANKTASRRRRSNRRHALDQNFYEEFLNFAEQQGVDFNEVENQNEDELYRFDEAMYDFLDVNSVDDDDRIYDLMDAASSFGVYSPGGNDHLHGPYEDVPVTPPSDEDYARSRAGYPGRQSSRKRRVANEYDTWDDTYDFLDHAKGRGYTMPKDMGDPDSGTFQDELWDYTRGDRSRMERITDTARDNWGGLRHSRRTRRGRR